MRTISLRQPWAFLLCSGIKDIENRTWKLPEKYKGERVLIHASAKDAGNPQLLFNNEDFEAIAMHFHNKWQKNVISEGELWDEIYRHRASIIGSVRFVDCTINHPSIWAEKTERFAINESWPNGRPESAGKKGDIYNWVATDAVLFDKPILNVKGKLSFWDYPMTEEEYNNLAKIGV